MSGNDILKRFRENVEKGQLFVPNARLLLAVSGGIDSIVMTDLCHRAGFEFMIAHCNFQLRGNESERDEAFVQRLGEKYGVRVLIKKFDTADYAIQHKISIQEAARNLRYAWFNDLITPDQGFSTLDCILTAHHADDNAETLLMHFCRGTGLHGLTGIPAVSGNIRRPLLSFSKEELIAYGKEQQLEWIEDSSNLSNKYTRNFFRNEIIPGIQQVYPQVLENLQDNIERFREIERLYQHSLGLIKKQLCRPINNNEIRIPIKQLLSYNNRALIYEIISEYGFSEKQVPELIKLVTSDTGKWMASNSGEYRLIRHRNWFIIAPAGSTHAANFIIEEDTRIIHFGKGAISIEKTDKSKPISASTLEANLDAKLISFPLLLRKAKAGDYFYPLGMKKKKKISRFLIDQKLSKTEKENSWVIEMNNKIIWVVGQRIDERFKITDKTGASLKIIFSNGQTG